MILGLGLGSLSVFILELIGIPLTKTSVFIALFSVALLLNVIPFSKGGMKSLFEILKNLRVDFQLYCLVPNGLAIFFFFVAAFRCFYFPITSFDSQVGIDLVAKYAVMEKTIASSVFHEHLPNVWYWTNQPFYAPFAMLMQIIYRIGGLAFGKIWLSILALSYFIFLYSKIKEYIHPGIAAFFTLLLTAVPEVYAYSFIVQTDYANAVYFFVGFVFFFEYFKNAEESRFRSLFLSIVFFALACWSRSETFVFVQFGTLLIFLRERKEGEWKRIIKWVALFSITPFIVFATWNVIFVKYFLPISPDTLGKLKFNFDQYGSDITGIISKTIDTVIFEESYWGYLPEIFVFILALSVFHKSIRDYWIILAWIFFIYLLFIFMIEHIGGVGIPSTFRRGFFKIIPMMVFFIVQTALISTFSKKLTQWEYGTHKKAP